MNVSSFTAAKARKIKPTTVINAAVKGRLVLIHPFVFVANTARLPQKPAPERGNPKRVAEKFIVKAKVIL